MSDTPYSDWMLTVPLARKDGSSRTVDDAIAALIPIFGAMVGQPERGGKTGYRHLQMFGQSSTRMRFATLKRKLSRAGLGDAHIDPRKGTVAEAVKYVTKDDTRDGDIIRIGDIDPHQSDAPRQGHRSDLDRLRARIMSGETVSQILLGEDGPTAAGCLNWLRSVSEAYEDATYRTLLRDVSVTYIWGPTGVGKTRYVTEHEGLGNVYIVDDYDHPFDGYDGQPAILLDEYANQLAFETMLRLLDRYPLRLKARYRNPWARYTRVWITANVSADGLYAWLPAQRRAALFRRISAIYRMRSDGVMVPEAPPALPGLASRHPVEMSPELRQLLLPQVGEIGNG